LSRTTLADLPASVEKPGYDPAGIAVGIVHLGLGAFHRAHQAVFTDAILQQDAAWGICGVSLRNPDSRDALAPQDNVYTLAVRDGDKETLRVIGSIAETLVAPEAPERVLARMSDPAVRIVSLTVTEKGYCHNPATGELDEAHPDIVHDLAHPQRPRSAPGFIVEALSRRRAAGIPPFTLLSCDNLPANGRTLKRIVARLAALRDRQLGEYAGAIACPSTMVDRIVPATTDADRSAVSRTLGVADAWPIVTEPFSQWVLEDDFPAGRPAWEKAGAVFSKDVTPFELMKLRLLNGSHSALAYLGFLAGAATVAEAMILPDMEKLIERMMAEEVTPTLPNLPGFDLPAYRRALRQRFHNKALHHRTAQIAMDGSQKLPQRLLNTIRNRLKAGAPFERLALGVAAWMRYASGIDEQGAAILVQDPLAERIAGMVRPLKRPEDIVSAFVGVKEVFGEDLPKNPVFVEAVTAKFAALHSGGAAAAIRKFA
jgi:fructuronate reductase